MNVVLQGEDLAGFEFVHGADGVLLVNGKPAPAHIADRVIDMCDVIVSLTLAPLDGADLPAWLAGVRAPVE